MHFAQEQPPINIGADISVKSFEMIEDELKNYEKFSCENLLVIKKL